jgi:acetoacetate decarboxylase
MLGGFYTVGDNSMLQGRALQKVNELEFLPYSFLKYEFEQNRT